MDSNPGERTKATPRRVTFWGLLTSLIRPGWPCRLGRIDTVFAHPALVGLAVRHGSNAGHCDNLWQCLGFHTFLLRLFVFRLFVFDRSYFSGTAPKPRYHGFERRPAACINCLIASGDSCGFIVVVVGIA